LLHTAAIDDGIGHPEFHLRVAAPSEKASTSAKELSVTAS
jgi:hypothetical protein